MIHFIFHCDARGLVQVEIIAPAEEHREAHKVWEAIRPKAENLGAVVQHLAAENQALTETADELSRQNGSGEGMGRGDGSHQG